jgi:hypothetical protein
MYFTTIKIPLIAIRGNKDYEPINNLLKQLNVYTTLMLDKDIDWYFPLIKKGNNMADLGIMSINPVNKKIMEEVGYCFFDTVEDARKALNEEGVVV